MSVAVSRCECSCFRGTDTLSSMLPGTGCFTASQQPVTTVPRLFTQQSRCLPSQHVSPFESGPLLNQIQNVLDKKMVGRLKEGSHGQSFAVTHRTQVIRLRVTEIFGDATKLRSLPLRSDVVVTGQWSSNYLLPDIAGYKYQEVLTGFTSWLQTWLRRLLVGRVPAMLKNLGISGNLKRFRPGKSQKMNKMLTFLFILSISF